MIFLVLVYVDFKKKIVENQDTREDAVIFGFGLFQKKLIFPRKRIKINNQRKKILFLPLLTKKKIKKKSLFLSFFQFQGEEGQILVVVKPFHLGKNIF
jgi:hypothetical protein